MALIDQKTDIISKKDVLKGLAFISPSMIVGVVLAADGTSRSNMAEVLAVPFVILASMLAYHATLKKSRRG